MLTDSPARRSWGAVWAAVTIAAMLAVSGAVPSALADECQEVTLPDGTVEIICGSGSGSGGPIADDPGDGGGGGPQVCRLDGRDVPCSSDFGYWDGHCYVRAAVDPVPIVGNPVWRGHEDGLIVECNPVECLGGSSPCPARTLDWVAEAPAQTGPSAEELAQRAVATMQLTMGQIGSTPPSSANATGAVGTIGLPIWLWIANPSENTIGPVTRSASDAGLIVDVVGTLDRVEWTLTDANGVVHGAITCDGANAPGTPYDGRDSAEPSPTCGFGADLNRVPGDLTLTGTAYWVVEWRGGDQTGQIAVPAQSNSVPVRIGELQALVEG